MLKALAILFSTRQQLLKVINMQKYPKNEFIYVSGLDGITFYSCWKSYPVRLNYFLQLWKVIPGKSELLSTVMESHSRQVWITFNSYWKSYPASLNYFLQLWKVVPGKSELLSTVMESNSRQVWITFYRSVQRISRTNE